MKKLIALVLVLTAPAVNARYGSSTPEARYCFCNYYDNAEYAPGIACGAECEAYCSGMNAFATCSAYRR